MAKTKCKLVKANTPKFGRQDGANLGIMYTIYAVS